MTAAPCPIVVRRVTALLDSGRAAYGEPAWMTVELPRETVAVTVEPDVTSPAEPAAASSVEPHSAPNAASSAEPHSAPSVTSPVASVRLWRIDVDASAPQPADRAAAFQEQRTFAAHRALDVTLDLDGVVGSVHDNHGIHGTSGVRDAVPSDDVGQPDGADGLRVHADPYVPADTGRHEPGTAEAGRRGDAADRLLALYQHKEWWMRPTWVDSPADLPERTQLMLRRHADGSWLALLAVCDADARADIAGTAAQSDCTGRDIAPPTVESGEPPTANHGRQSSTPHAAGLPVSAASALRLTVATNRVGRTAIHETVGYVALAADPYAAIRAAVDAAARRLGVATRAARPFPAALTGLGWCTWDSLGRDVNETAIIAKMEEFAAKQVPIAWVLIDDGWSHTDRDRETLLGFGADPQRFPHGLAHTVDVLRTRFGVRHVGVWQAYHGYWRGVDARGEAAALTQDALVATGNGCLIPGADATQAAAFWDAWDARLADAGIDVVKVDSQSSTAVMTRGAESYGESSRGRHCALDEVTGRRFGGALINCMGMAPEDYWHRPTSPITRSSDDYLPHEPESLAEHVLQNAYCALLMGELYHCDWDMFWTDHPHARTHAVLRALSGGPVYCSDALGRTDAGVLRALLDADGRLVRPDEPARPLADSLLHDPTCSDTALGVTTRFGDTQVVAFVGLRAQPQTGRLVAADGPLTVTELTADAAGTAGDRSVGQPGNQSDGQPTACTGDRSAGHPGNQPVGQPGGRTIRLNTGEQLTCTVGYGEARVFSFRHTDAQV